jgi:hypothetical protein
LRRALLDSRRTKLLSVLACGPTLKRVTWTIIFSSATHLRILLSAKFDCLMHYGLR